MGYWPLSCYRHILEGTSNHDARVEGGESYTDIAARFMPFIGRLEERHRHTDANVLLISHGQTLALMLPRLLSNVDWAYSSTHTFDGTFYAVAELRDGEWVCLRWGEEMMVEGGSHVHRSNETTQVLTGGQVMVP